MHRAHVAVTLAFATCLAASTAGHPASVRASSATSGTGPVTAQPVQGTGVHVFSTAIVHSTEPTPTGMIQTSTETVELSGDLTGRILYQPRSVYDLVNGTLVNTGNQVFSGTVLGSAPVLLFDDEFRFEVNLVTGETRGVVHLTDSLAGPKVRCTLIVTGAGLNAEGNALVNYSGECRFRGNS